MRVFSWPRLSLIRARLLFSIIGLDDFKTERIHMIRLLHPMQLIIKKKQSTLTESLKKKKKTLVAIHGLPFCARKQFCIYPVLHLRSRGWQQQRMEMSSPTYRLASLSFFHNWAAKATQFLYAYPRNCQWIIQVIIQYFPVQITL